MSAPSHLSRSPAAQPTAFSGPDVYPAWANAITLLVVGGLLTLVAWRLAVRAVLPLVVATLGSAGVGAWGTRFRLIIASNGIELTTLVAWWIPTRRRRWYLDARIDLYESWEADRPEGLCVQPPIASDEDASPCFGPTREDRLRDLQRLATEAVLRARSLAPACPPQLRHARLGGESSRFDFEDVVRFPNGRIRELRSRDVIRWPGLDDIPPGSRFRFNGAPSLNVEDNADAFIDPRREDVLYEIEVSAPVRIFSHVTNSGAKLRFSSNRFVGTLMAFPSEAVFEGRIVRGDQWLGFQPDGTLSAFTLARGTTLAGFEFGADSRFDFWRGSGRLLPARWTCRLGAALVLPAFTLQAGDACELSVDLARLTGIAPRADLILPEGRLRGGVMSARVSPDGRIDLAWCRKAGLIVP